MHLSISDQYVLHVDSPISEILQSLHPIPTEIWGVFLGLRRRRWGPRKGKLKTICSRKQTNRPIGQRHNNAIQTDGRRDGETTVVITVLCTT